MVCVLVVIGLFSVVSGGIQLGAALFDDTEEKEAYELRLRNILSEVWLGLAQLARPLLERPASPDRSSGQIKTMLAYIHEHYPEKITSADLAAAAYLSERGCYRLFRDCLHTTPAEYITGYRLQAACRMLVDSARPVAEVGWACGLGSSSHFGSVFRRAMGCTPTEYRRRWQDRDTTRRD